jgi:hypothetical protein
MSWKLAKKDISLLIRNPVTYLGLILMVGIVIFTVSPFWNLYGNVRDAQSPVIYDSDGEIEAGFPRCCYIFCTQIWERMIRQAVISIG